MKKNLTLLMIAAASLTFAQVKKVSAVKAIALGNNATQTLQKADEQTYSQLSDETISQEISVLSCSDLSAPIQ